jgi:hypothetical protein
MYTPPDAQGKATADRSSRMPALGMDYVCVIFQYHRSASAEAASHAPARSALRARDADGLLAHHKRGILAFEVRVTPGPAQRAGALTPIA